MSRSAGSKKRLPPRSIRRLFPKLDRVIDADKPVEIKVTEGDCAKGKRLKSGECALAQAALRQFKADGAVIGLSCSYVIKNKTAIRFATPSTVQREIVSFDRHNDFAPGRYCLSPISPSQRLDRDRGRDNERARDYWRRKKDRSKNHSPTHVVHKRTVRVRESAV